MISSSKSVILTASDPLHLSLADTPDWHWALVSRPPSWAVMSVCLKMHAHQQTFAGNCSSFPSFQEMNKDPNQFPKPREQLAVFHWQQEGEKLRRPGCPPMIPVWWWAFVPSYPHAWRQEGTPPTLPRGRWRCASASWPFHAENIYPLSHHKLMLGMCLVGGWGGRESWGEEE